MKKIVFLTIVAGLLFATSASAAGKNSSWLPYPEWIKKNKK